VRIDFHRPDRAPSGAAGRWRARLGRLGPWVWPAAMVLAFGAGVIVRDRLAPHEMSERLGFRTEIVGVARAILANPVTALGSLVGSPELPTLTIDMGAGEVRAVEDTRREALRLGVLVAADEDLVPARIRVGGRTVRVRMRLKGDLPDHWDGDKWSYRIHVRDDDAIFGMRRFSVQHPKTRNYLAEWAWLAALRHDGVLAPRYEFVRIVFNGTDKGIYALEEHFSKELLESQQRREGVIIAFDENVFWARYLGLGRSPADYDPLQPVLADLFRWPVVTMREARVEADPFLSDQRDAAVGLIRGLQAGRLRPSDVFDIERLARFMAVSEVFEASHGLLNSSLRFYLDPLSAKLEPIAFDGNAQQARVDGLYSFARSSLRPMLQAPTLAGRFVQELERVSQPAYLDEIRGALGNRLDAFARALFREFPRAVDVDSIWAGIERRQGEIRRLLDVPQPAIAHAIRPASPATPADVVSVDVRNTTAVPVEVLGFRRGADFVDASGVLSASSGTGGHATDAGAFRVLQPTAPGAEPHADSATFEVPATWLSEAGPEGLTVEVRLLGRQASVAVPVREVPAAGARVPLPAWPTLDEVLRAHPFLARDPVSGQLTVRAGTWHVSGDLVLPEGAPLAIVPGTELRFETGAVLLSSGPVHISGSADEPVVLRAADHTWAGIVVLDAADPSVWSHVRVGGMTGVNRPGWSLTGAITFYRSGLRLANALVHDTTAEDALNVVRADFELRDSRFAATASDAFDGDFTTGVIERCEFRDIGGDAVDVSGSDIRVLETTVERAGDKAVSVGEASRAEVARLRAVDVRVAIASKDGSDVRASQLTIVGARLSGLAAYEKKREFGPGRLEARGVLFEETATPALVDPGSVVVIDGREQPGSAADRQALDRGGVFVN